MHQEAKELNDPVWDCTLIKNMREHNDTLVNPIYEWTDADIWEYIRQENIIVNPLYARGYKRVGCIGCPLSGYHNMKKEFNDYPRYKQLYINAFERMIVERKKKGKHCEFKTGEEVFNWWIEEYKHNVKGQISLFEKGEIKDEAI